MNPEYLNLKKPLTLNPDPEDGFGRVLSGNTVITRSPGGKHSQFSASTLFSTGLNFTLTPKRLPF